MLLIGEWALNWYEGYICIKKELYDDSKKYVHFGTNFNCYGLVKVDEDYAYYKCRSL